MLLYLFHLVIFSSDPSAIIALPCLVTDSLTHSQCFADLIDLTLTEEDVYLKVVWDVKNDI